MQKRIVRLIAGVPPREHTAPLFMKYGILQMSQIADYNIGIFMYKIYYKEVPAIFDSYFTLNCDIHDYNTRQRCCIHVDVYMLGFMDLRGPRVCRRSTPVLLTLSTLETQCKGIYCHIWRLIRYLCVFKVWFIDKGNTSVMDFNQSVVWVVDFDSHLGHELICIQDLLKNRGSLHFSVFMRLFPKSCCLGKPRYSAVRDVICIGWGNSMIGI